MGKTEEQRKIVLELKQWAKIGKWVVGLILLGNGIYYIFALNLIERFWNAGEFNVSLLNGATIYVIVYILLWFGIGLLLLVPCRVQFDADGIRKSGILGATRLPFRQVDRLQLSRYSVSIHRSKLLVFISASRILHENFDSVIKFLSEKVDEEDMEVKGNEELVEAFLQSEGGREYLQNPVRIFGSTSKKGVSYFAGFAVVAIGIIAMILIYGEQIEQVINKWAFMGIYFLLIAGLMWIGGNILLKYSNNESNK